MFSKKKMKKLIILISIISSFWSIFKIQHLNASLNWISIAKQKKLDYNNELICDGLIGFSPVQKEFCKNNFDFLETIQKAAVLTLEECQSQFKSRRWNCSTTNNLSNIFAKLPESGMRESSYIYALSSAALAYQITSACSNGLLSDCSCYDSKEGVTFDGHRWSGCSDNIAYGMAISENFLDAKLKNKNKIDQVLINLHNFETGRRIIEKNMVKQCKCHGVSGSCEIKTCWKALPSFRIIGSKLKEKYDEAIQVEVKLRGNKRRLISKNQYGQKISKSELIYMKESPDFCYANTRLAAYGTKGRVCNKSSRGIDSCKLLCCGRNYKTKLETIKYKCSCTFKWCCSVSCQECTKTQYVSTCK